MAFYAKYEIVGTRSCPWCSRTSGAEWIIRDPDTGRSIGRRHAAYACRCCEEPAGTVISDEDHVDEVKP
jgi:hypothetical protein